MTDLVQWLRDWRAGRTDDATPWTGATNAERDAAEQASNMYIVNVSSVQDFMQCRYRWVCKWVLNRVPRKEGDALVLGQALHRIFESVARDGGELQHAATQVAGVLEAQLPSMKPWDRETTETTLKKLAELWEAWPLWHDIYPMDVPVLEVEEPFTIEFPEMPNVVFRGRPDRVCIMNGLIWHVQNRGLASSMNFATYSRLAKRHMHEHLYAEHLARKYARDGDYGGTLFNLVRKLKFRTNVGKKNEKVKTAAEMFWQHPMSIRLDSLNHRTVMEDLFDHVEEMRRIETRVRDGGRLPAPNDKLNGGFSGSSEDPYFKLMIGEIDLRDDNWFKDREDTYAVADVDAGQD